MKSFNEIIHSPTYSKIIKILGIVLIMIVIFGAGVSVGVRTSEFSNRWNNNYGKNFGGDRSPFRPFGLGDERGPGGMMMIDHGAFGEIVAVNLPTIAIKGPNEAEKVVVIGTSTKIRSMSAEATTTDLKVGNKVVVIGQPDNSGRIQAVLIRMMPVDIQNPILK